MRRSRRGFQSISYHAPTSVCHIHYKMLADAGRKYQDCKTAQMGPETTLFMTVGMKSIPVWVFSLIYSYTTPSQSARFCDTPHATASSPPPQTQRTCRQGRYPGARPRRPGSGSQSPPRGSREGLEGGRPAPRLRRLLKEVPRERSCPLGRGC